MQIAIVLYPRMTALDAIGPYEVLRLLPGVDLRFVWHEPGPITTDSGVLVLGATHAFAEVPAPDVLLVPGASTSFATVARDEGVLEWLRAADAHTTWTTSVCTGSIILGAAGLLDGRPATTHWAAQVGLAAHGATYRADERVVRSGKVLTAAGVSAGIDLALLLAAELAGEGTARAIQLAIEYDPEPPFDSGHLGKAGAGVRKDAAKLFARESARLAKDDPRATAGDVGALSATVWKSAIAAVRARRG